MRVLLVMMLLLVAIGGWNSVWGATPYRSDGELQAEVKQGMEDILDLWRDGRYGDLYDRTVTRGTGTKEKFIKSITAAPLRPACCWEKLQEVKVSIKGEGVVTVRAKLGFEGGGSTDFKTRSFKLVKEDGVWCMSQKDILSLAEAGKKKKFRKRGYTYTSR